MEKSNKYIEQHIALEYIRYDDGNTQTHTQTSINRKAKEQAKNKRKQNTKCYKQNYYNFICERNARQHIPYTRLRREVNMRAESYPKATFAHCSQYPSKM